MRKMQKTGLLIVVVIVLGSAFASVGRADYIYDVTVDTSILNPVGTYYAYFQLSGNNGDSAAISNFSGALTVPGSGSAVFADTGSNTTGGNGTAAGDLYSTITLTDDTTNTSQYSGFYQPIVVGTSISFHLDLAGPLASSNPDAFEFDVLDVNGNPLPTTDPSGDNNLVTITMDYTGPDETAFALLPEPSSLGFLGVSALLILRRRRLV